MQLVFAYGSNLRYAQMLSRAPSAVAKRLDTLARHRLAFVGHSRTWGGAVATVIPDARSSVEGLVYEISASDLKTLDTFEGHPTVYKRTLMPLRKAGEVWVYVHQRPEPGRCSFRYFAAVLEGRLAAGLDAEPVVRAAE